MGYPSKRKAAILLKMLPPNNKPIAQLAIEESIAQGTLYNWRATARAQGQLMPDAKDKGT
jgi:transposase-like protein